MNYQLEMKALIEVIEPEVLALIFLKSAFDAAGAFDKLPIQRVANWIGGRIEDETRFRFYESLGCQRLTKAATKRATQANSNPHYRSKSARLISEKIATDLGLPLWEPWSSYKRCGLALYLMEIAKEAGILVNKVTWVSPSKQQTFIEFSPAYMQQQQELLSQVESLEFDSWPLLVPPIPWQTSTTESRNNYSGGYHSELFRNQLPMCRGSIYRSVFSSATTDLLNTLGHTAWVIDQATYLIAQDCFSRNLSVGSLKAPMDRTIVDQPMPAHLVALPTSHQDRREWRKTQSQLKDLHQKSVQRSIRGRSALSLASQYLKHPRFYLSWSADYRSRVYSQQPWLNPQTTDVEKSLIRFADGCRLDLVGQRWVETAIGASFIGTKGSFQQRQQWCMENQELIKAVSADPIGTIKSWDKADEPWSFIQLCIEYCAVVIDGSRSLWGVPLQVDATSSGLQILSASLLDDVGCQFSNVTATGLDQPQDAYREVVRKAAEIASKTPEWQRYVPYLKDRSLGKASLLVALYGGSHGTRVNRVINALMDLNLYPDPLGWKDANEITKIIHQASIQTFPKAFQSLDWLKKLGRIAIKNGLKEFVWSTPFGDRIALRELKRETTIIRTKHLGRLTVTTGCSSEISPGEMINALAPSFVHSLDACILKGAIADWNHPVSCIHDCVAVLPADIDRMLERLRRGFAFTVANDPLAKLADDLGVSSTQLPRLDLGTADLSVLSPYMFS